MKKLLSVVAVFIAIGVLTSCGHLPAANVTLQVTLIERTDISSPDSYSVILDSKVWVASDTQYGIALIKGIQVGKAYNIVSNGGERGGRNGNYIWIEAYPDSVTVVP